MNIIDKGKRVLLANMNVVKTSNKDEHHGMASQSRWFKCFCLCAAFFGLGLCMALPGSTLIDLQRRVNTTEAHVTSIFTGRGTGYLVGALASGAVLDRVKEPPVMALSLLLLAIVNAVIPWSNALFLMVSLFVLQGVSLGFLTTGGNLLCVNNWGKQSAPYMQGMHLAMGIGAFAAPLLVEPFLFHSHASSNSPDISNENLNSSTTNSSESVTIAATHPVITMNHVQFSYLIVSLLLLKMSFLFCCLESADGTSSETRMSNEIISTAPSSLRKKLTILLFFFYFCSVGIQHTYGALSAQFSQDYFYFPDAKATYIIAVFWGSFALFQLTSIFLSRILVPTTMLLISLLLVVFSTLVLSTTGSHEAVLWICSSTLGMGLATIFPTGIVWAEGYMKITAKATSVFVVGAALGEMIMPLVVASLMNSNAMWLMYSIFTVSLINVSLFLILYLMANKTGDRYYSPLISKDDMDDEEAITFDKSWLSDKGGKLKPKFTQELVLKDNDVKND